MRLHARLTAPASQLLLLPLLILLLATPARSQGFTEISGMLVDVTNPSVAWGDFDNDGDLDILLTGNDSGDEISILYENDGASFGEFYTDLLDVENSSVAWGDYDNDGDLDILLTGSDPGRTTRIYRNDGYDFTQISEMLEDVDESSVAWGDFDNDGDLDILLTGEGNSDLISKIYQNNEGSFVDIGSGLTGVSQSSVAWGDYDNDDDLDILLTGNSDSGRVSLIYQNDNGIFTDISAGLPGVRESSAAWGDFDNDGDLDILLTGSSDSGAISRIYTNNGGIFTDIGAGLLGVEESSAAWGDYDNDGDLDILLAGKSESGDKVAVIYNNAAGSFTDISAGLIGVQGASVAWGDYDSDNDLDILLTGKEGPTGGVSIIYQNESLTANTAPGAPTNPNASVSSNSVQLDWNSASDAQTPSAGLTYNLRIGTTPGGSEICAAHALSSGMRTVPALGNANHNTSWALDLPFGTYYWGVQAVDAGFAGSSFTSEAAFYVYSDSLILTKIDVGLPGVYSSSLEWGDFDNDGDLDLLLAGRTESSTNITNIYENDGGTFVDIGAGLPGVVITSAKWGDFDSDGDLDILLTGWTGSDHIANVYRNDAGVFVDISAGLVGVQASSVDWGDYDNDGDLDILLSGEGAAGGRFALLYRNDDGIFLNDVSVQLPGVSFSSLDWGDFDNDGDLDILMAGVDDSHDPSSRIYRNDSGVFTEIGVGSLLQVTYASVAWGDYDNDGDLDVLLAGSNVSDYHSRVYRNDGGSFVDIVAGLTGIGQGSASWGDFDIDGDLDILLTGSGNGGPVSIIYQNEEGIFSDSGTNLTAFNAASADWGDYDADGDLDLILAGSNLDGKFCELYRNDIPISNSSPSAPSNLDAIYSDGALQLLWNASSDEETPTSGLTYNVRIGSTPGGEDICADHALSSGLRTVPDRGNAHAGTSWSIDELPFREYYWSVQSIDTGFQGSSFATEVHFYPAAFVSSIEDVGGDQGRNVRLTWTRSDYDSPGSSVDITGYGIYRRQDDRLEGWDFVATAPANGEDIYSYVAPTLCDSTTENGICWSVFMVRTLTAEPLEFVDSPPDSGYSVDNLAPSVPSGFEFVSSSMLSWDNPIDPDFRYFTVYGSETDIFDETAVFIDHTINTEMDVTGHAYTYFHLTARDFAGNESGAATVASPTDVLPGLPERFALHAPSPNPFNPKTFLRFDLPEAAQVSLKVYDMSGRLVCVLLDEHREAGRYEESWNGRDDRGRAMSSGIYLCRIDTDSFSQSKRMTLLK